MKIFILEELLDREWRAISYHQTKQGATKEKYSLLTENPYRKLIVEEQEVQE